METQAIVLSLLLGFVLLLLFKFFKTEKVQVTPDPIDPSVSPNCAKPIIISVSDVNEKEIAVDFVYDYSDCIYSVIQLSQDNQNWSSVSQNCFSPVVVKHDLVKPFYVRMMLECQDNKFSELSETFTVI